MINILIDELPTKVIIGGAKYEINSDFRISILFEMMMQDDTLSQEEKVKNTLELFYPTIPEDVAEAIDKVIWFYSCNNQIKTSGGKKKSSKKQIYSFEDDAEYIFAAFLDQYRVDLNQAEYLHWWKFKAMFKALKEDNEIVKIMSYRSMDLSKIKDKEQKAFYKQMQELYKIKERLTDEDLAELEKWNEILK